MLGPDEPWPETVERDHVVRMTMGGMIERATDDEPAFGRVDEAQLALDAEPESEVLGTAARTARVVASERAKPDTTLAGTMRLVSAPEIRF